MFLIALIFVFSEGWLHSGDIGCEMSDGYFKASYICWSKALFNRPATLHEISIFPITTQNVKEQWILFRFVTLAILIGKPFTPDKALKVFFRQ